MQNHVSQYSIVEIAGKVRGGCLEEHADQSLSLAPLSASLPSELLGLQLVMILSLMYKIPVGSLNFQDKVSRAQYTKSSIIS